MNKLVLNPAQLAAYFESPIASDHAASVDALFEGSSTENAEELNDSELVLLKSNLMNLRIIKEHAGFALESMALLKKVTTVESLQTFISIANCEYHGRRLSKKGIDNATESINTMFDMFKKSGQEFQEKWQTTVDSITSIWFKKK